MLEVFSEMKIRKPYGLYGVEYGVVIRYTIHSLTQSFRLILYNNNFRSIYPSYYIYTYIILSNHVALQRQL